MSRDIPLFMFVVGIAGMFYFGGLLLVAVIALILIRGLMSFLPEEKPDYRAENNRRAESRDRRQEIKFYKWLEEQEEDDE